MWLTITGFSVMAVVLTAMGFVQGAMLEYGVNFVDTVKELHPWWVARSVSGAIVQGIIPWLMPETRAITVEEAVTKHVIQVADYTPIERQGRQVYIREGCWYCHSQYIRPVTGEGLRWGPVSQAGEYAYDFPHLFSTRRIGPDLTRVGRKYGDDWHAAHHWNPGRWFPTRSCRHSLGCLNPRTGKNSRG